MNLDKRLQNVAVIGAAGKMGSGISLLLARELALRALAQPDDVFVLNLIDVHDRALQGLLRYLREQAAKEAEKQMGRLRALYRERTDLVENGEIVQEFVHEVLLHVRTGKAVELAKESTLIFEAAFEKEDLKVGLYRQLAALCPPETYFLTNTSSIPLHVLAEQAGIQGRLIGYHFYNPPAVQRLVELITPTVCDEALKQLSVELAELLGKTLVPANDIAGFIGNGHFMRDGLHAIHQVERLAAEHGHSKAVFMVDTAVRELLARPMGMFQLIDYVGIDVFQLILRVMEHYLHEGLHSDLVDLMMEQGIRGGQTSAGAQKDGFLRYDHGRITGVYDPEGRTYVDVDPAWMDALGCTFDPACTWKALQRDPERDERLAAHFRALPSDASLGAQLALETFRASRDIALKLVADGVAPSAEEVNAVLTLGFFHLYGPVNDFVA